MLVAYSHLRWGFVWQRPQHLLSRFARHMPVIVVEEPELGAERNDMRVRHDRGVCIVTPRLTQTSRCGFGPEVNAEIAELVSPLVAPDEELIIWYYTPMALGAEPTTCRPALTVYDAMDDLAAFAGAPPALRRHEARLLSQVDLVFAGGPSLYRRHRDGHRAVHCVPSGVEPAHFAPAANGLTRRAELACLPRPILGFYGVIDERLDLALLADIADLRPEWTIALIGPVAKIDASTIPLRPNIRRFGKQNYRDLPAFLAGFDVALLPFARNAATHVISPTKTLEYLAGGKPVVSTPITDVVELYGEMVEIASTAEEFASAVEAVLCRPDDEVVQWGARAARLVATNNWDIIAAAMLDIMALARVAPMATAMTAPAALSA
jgi:UDP-galactopyranose mutase